MLEQREKHSDTTISLSHAVAEHPCSACSAATCESQAHACSGASGDSEASSSTSASMPTLLVDASSIMVSHSGASRQQPMRRGETGIQFNAPQVPLGQQTTNVYQAEQAQLPFAEKYRKATSERPPASHLA
jgi:hypothetical protein